MAYAEEFNYWQTTVHPAKSHAEIIEMLEDYGIIDVNLTQGQAAGSFAWLIRFKWHGKPYRFIFTPLECKEPERVYSVGGKKRTGLEQAKYQMGRIAVYFVKAIMTAAEAHPAALFGFMEIENTRDNSGMPLVIYEVGADKLLGSG